MKVENWVTFKIRLFSAFLICQPFFSIIPVGGRHPYLQLPDFPDVYWF